MSFIATAESTAERIGEITRLLKDMRAGDRGAFDRLVPVIYGELKRFAEAQLRFERPDHTLDPTALVAEAYLKLAGNAPEDWFNRAHFYSIAARTMRQVLVDRARRRLAEKRGGTWERTTLAGKEPALEVAPEELLSLNEALDRLGALSETQRQIVEYKFFGGMTEQEIGAVLGISARTVQRQWVKARAWLYREIYPESP